ncbi:Sua5/YciO/YrdC/YwlC family protein [Amycolatopsis orientalis]|uniref:Sua5/YciO/YrdC/YwlC family protein n=1 Tax=Amycolatopsis orientalis TaxID=31958 RepID=UPI000695BFEB|nr:Sua5/YciO/YrdC/YwlC family protein [Amycolatopsis orientalis]
MVNEAKGRPATQSVALWLTDDERWTEFTELTDVDERTRSLMHRLLVAERVTLLVPLRECPKWAESATRDGKALVFAARWSRLAPVLTGVGRLHVSSANRTGHAPCGSPEQARKTFPEKVHVLDMDDGRPADGRSATTTLELRHDGSVSHVRTGAQDRAHGGPAAYLTYLARTYGVRGCR